MRPSWASDRESSPRGDPGAGAAHERRCSHSKKKSRTGAEGARRAECAPALGSDARFEAYDLCRMGGDILESLRERWKISPKMRGLFLMMSTPGDSSSDAVLKRMIASIVESFERSAACHALVHKYYVLVGKSGELYGIAEWVAEEAAGRAITEGVLARFEYVPSGAGPVGAGSRLTIEVMNAHAGTSFRFMDKALKALRDRGSTMLVSTLDYSIFTKSASWRDCSATPRGRHPSPPPPIFLPPPAVDWNLAHSAHPYLGSRRVDDFAASPPPPPEAWAGSSFMGDADQGQFDAFTNTRPDGGAAPPLPPPANSVMESLRVMLASWQGAAPATPSTPY